MRVVLIDPPTAHEQIYGEWDLSKLDTYCPPLGLLYLASFLRSHKHTPHVLDLTAQKWSLGKAVAYVREVDPGLVGISAKTINIFNAARLAEAIKLAGVRCPIVLGGAHVTAVPVETLRRFPSIDVGVVGEGEQTLQDIVDHIDCGASLSGIPGIVRRDGESVVVNPPRPVVEDLDTLPMPAWDLLETFPGGYTYSALETKRLPAASLMTSRGCPFSCTFCDNKVFGRTVRHHGADYTLDMLRHLKEEYGVRDLMILDDNFLLKKDKLFQVCDTMLSEDMGFYWYCMGHARSMTRERLSPIREAGCWIIELGIESGCDRILKVLKKNATKLDIATAVRNARDAGLKVKGNFIMGCPTETKESLEETIRFATSIPLSYFQQNFLTVWPGCEISMHPEKYGEHDADWKRLAHQRVTFVPHGLTEADLVEASKRAFRRFYLRPRIMMEVAIGLTSLRAIRTVLTAFRAFIGTIVRRPRRKAGGEDFSGAIGRVGSRGA